MPGLRRKKTGGDALNAAESYASTTGNVMIVDTKPRRSLKQHARNVFLLRSFVASLRNIGEWHISSCSALNGYI